MSNICHAEFITVVIILFSVLNLNKNIECRHVVRLRNHSHISIREVANKNSQFCYGEIGCIENSEDWFDPKYRPVNFKPLARHTIHTQFLLLTKNKTFPEYLVFDLIVPKKKVIAECSFFNEFSNIILLIHDFTSNGYTGWIKHFAKILITYGYICICVDWEPGAEPPYDQAISNARIVALETVYFLKLLKEVHGIKYDKIHIIGHGVGAHIAGYIGKLALSIGMITALDPSGPRFEGMCREVRLDQTDARLVQALHTDAYGSLSQGTSQNMGHIDFMINGAKFQPGCNKSVKSVVKLDRNQLTEGDILPDCSHKRAFRYYLEFLHRINDCEFIGFSARSYKDFLLDRVNYCEKEWDCAKFQDIPSRKPIENRTYYLMTNSKSPFCIQPYRIKIQLETNPHAEKLTTGYFEFILVSKNGQFVNSTTGNQKKKSEFENGKCYTLLNYASPTKISDISEAKVKWIHKGLCLFCDTSIYVDSFQVQSIKLDNSTAEKAVRLCPLHGSKLMNKVYKEFQLCAEVRKCDLHDKTTTTAHSHSICNEDFDYTTTTTIKTTKNAFRKKNKQYKCENE